MISVRIKDGRRYFWQWDVQQKLIVESADELSEPVMHFKLSKDRALVVSLTNGEADVPDELLQIAGVITAYVYVGANHTIYAQRFLVQMRPKPDDYAYTPAETRTWDELAERIGDLESLETEEKGNLVGAINEIAENGGTGGTSDHSKLTNRDAADQHPIGAITGLQSVLDGKQPSGSYLTAETDPTVPAWAKAASKPSYTAAEVGALPDTTKIPSKTSDLENDSGFLTQHQSLSDYQPKAITDAGSFFTTDTVEGALQELGEAKQNSKEFVEIVDLSSTEIPTSNLTPNEIMQAAENGKVLMIFGALVSIYNSSSSGGYITRITLSRSNGDELSYFTVNSDKSMEETGGMKFASTDQVIRYDTEQSLTDAQKSQAQNNLGLNPTAKTDAMTQAVGRDSGGLLWTAPGSGGGSSTTSATSANTFSEVNQVQIDLPAGCTKFVGTIKFTQAEADSTNKIILYNSMFGTGGTVAQQFVNAAYTVTNARYIRIAGIKTGETWMVISTSVIAAAASAAYFPLLPPDYDSTNYPLDITYLGLVATSTAISGSYNFYFEVTTE